MTRHTFTRAVGLVLVLLTLVIAGCSAKSSSSNAPPPDIAKLYHDPASHVAVAMAELLRDGNRNDARKLAKIASQPTAHWLTGGPDDVSELTTRLAKATADQSLAEFVIYNVPQRDIGAGQSSGGAADDQAYRQWINSLADAIAHRPVLLIVEPDAVTAVAENHLSGQDAANRLSDINYAVTTLAANPLARVYLDAGNAGWQSPEAMAAPLQAAGVTHAHGIAVNVANFYSDQVSLEYAERITKILGSGGIVIDTSRNGNGPAAASSLSWCNPPGRALGRNPALAPSGQPVDAWLWIKPPGDSDGSCRPGEPPAGQFWLAYALDLIAK